MKSLFHVFVAFVTAMLLAGCGGRGALMPAAGSVPSSNRQASTAGDSGGGPTLYVSGSGGTAIFAAGGAKYLRKIRTKTAAVTTDSRGHLYVAGETATAVDVYENRGAKLAWKIHTKPYYPRQLNLDDVGDLYVNCGDSNLCEYGPHTKGLIRQIRGSGSLLALDASGNLYLAAGLHAIAIYAPGSSSPERTITNGINYPQLLALDPQGNLYVANAYAGSQRAPNVTVYAPGASSPTRTITSGLTTPWVMATDSSSNLYVLNECAGSGGCTNSQNNVVVYAQDSDLPTVVTDGLDFPLAIAVDGSSNLYVANNGRSSGDPGSVTVYTSGTHSLIRTVTRNVVNPRFLSVAFGVLQQRQAQPAHRRGYTWMAAEAKSQDLLYVSNALFNEVWVFSYPGGHPVGYLTGFALPAGICVNQRTGDIFVSDVLANRIQAYAHGGTNPIRTLPDSKNPQGCSVDPSTGDLAVADYTSQAPGKVAIFPNATAGPTRYGDPNFTSFSSCGYDGDGNLFADGLTYGDQPGLAELAKGSRKFKDITLDKSIDAIGDIRWDGRNLAVMADSGNWIYRLAITGSSAKIVGRTSIETARHDDNFWIQANRVFVTYYPPHSKYPAVGFWHYPAGGQPAKMLSNMPGVQDIGVSVAAK